MSLHYVRVWGNIPQRQTSYISLVITKSNGTINTEQIGGEGEGEKVEGEKNW